MTNIISYVGICVPEIEIPRNQTGKLLRKKKHKRQANKQKNPTTMYEYIPEIREQIYFIICIRNSVQIHNFKTKPH